MRTSVIAALLLLFSISASAQSGKSTDSRKSGPAAKEASKETKDANSPPAWLPSEETVEGFLRHMFSYDSSIQWKVGAIKPSQVDKVAEVTVVLKAEQGQQMMNLFVMPDQKWALTGELLPFGEDPFAPVNKKLEKADGPARGAPGDEIKIVEFSDLECPACKKAQPVVDKLLEEVPKAHFIFQNYPLPAEMHPWAFKAAEYADCVAHEKAEAFWKFIELDYENQESVNIDNADEKLKEFAAQAGVNPGNISACVANSATAARVHESMELGNDVGVNSTPTLFINGRRITNVTGMPSEILKKLAEGTPK